MPVQIRPEVRPQIAVIASASEAIQPPEWDCGLLRRLRSSQ
jgi:hypothetical protein